MRVRSIVTGSVLCLLACSTSSAPASATSAAQPASPPGPGDAPVDVATQPGEPPIADGAKAQLGKPAPDFTLVDLDGKTHRLSEHAGKIVVLEWFNPGCPFVKYAHTDGPLVKMAKEEIEKGVVWLAINSNAAGKQGHDPQDNRDAIATFGMTHPVLRDETGAVGRAYGALKTPHMFLIDATGVLQFAGGIDNAPMGEVDGGGEPRNHLAEALADVRAGKPVRQSGAAAWGCTVKYAD